VKAVEIVQDPKIIAVLADPVRREIVRLTTLRPMTETQLAKKLALTKSSTAHHLKILRNAMLIKIEKTEVGKHGIVEKYYSPRSALFIEDWEKIPLNLKRYFLQGQMERLKGILSVIQLAREKRGEGIELTSEMLEELAEDMAKKIVVIAKRYEKQELSMNREMLHIKIYSETLEEIAREKKWQGILALKEPLRHAG